MYGVSNVNWGVSSATYESDTGKMTMKEIDKIIEWLKEKYDTGTVVVLTWNKLDEEGAENDES
jgi:hypothetical protein